MNTNKPTPSASRSAKAVSYRLPPELVERMKEAAEQDGQQITAWLIDAITARLNVSPDVSPTVSPGIAERLALALTGKPAADLEQLTPAELLTCIAKRIATVSPDAKRVSPAVSPAVSPPAQTVSPAVSPNGGRYDYDAALDLMRKRLQEQDASGQRRDLKAIAAELNTNGLTQQNGSAWNNDRVSNWIKRYLPDLYRGR